jgi:hypothetical protein
MDAAAFLRVHAARSPALAWFLGAGASAQAGVPTADQMVWEFKRTIFCSEQRVPVRACQNLNDPALRQRIQRHFDAGGHPPAADPEEYSHYFELAYPTEADRRGYIDAHIRGAAPSFGHFALAALMAAGRIRLVWSTNFDPCLCDAAARVFGSTANVTSVGLDNPGVASSAIREERWPIEVKLHGDFRSARLKNVSAELRSQDGILRRTLIESAARFGLVVIGYSGRDDSIMEALEEAVASGGFPAGLYWIHRGEGPPFARVEQLIAAAQASGIDAAIVQAESFDELLGDVLRQTPDVPDEYMQMAERSAPRLTAAPLPPRGSSWPVLRTNALQVVEFPTTCRRVDCEIGGVREVRAAVKRSGAADRVVVTRTRAGVLAFGADEALRTALADQAIKQMDLHSIDPDRLAWESGEHGLLSEAMAKALVRDRPLLARRRRQRWVAVIDPRRSDDSALAPLRDAVSGALHGRLPSGGHWGEGVELRLDWRLDCLWLLLEPDIWLSASGGRRRPAKDMEFVRKRKADRYNAAASNLLEAWIEVLLAGDDVGRVETFGGVAGVDAAFVLEGTTAFSRRAVAAHIQKEAA